MFTKTAIALAVIVSTVSGALAQTNRHSTNPAHDVYSNGKYLGSDPDQNVRSRLMYDQGRD
jgi:hypothetical protein